MIEEIIREYNFCTTEAVSNLVVIHYGAKQYQHSQIDKIKNRQFVKPNGGIWTSPVNSNWGWKDWCENNDFRTYEESNCFKLKFKADARILIIDSLEDLKKLPTYVVTYSDKYKKEYVDFELLSEVSDAIWLTTKGESKTRFSEPIDLYGWDCESVLITNKDCCYQVK